MLLGLFKFLWLITRTPPLGLNHVLLKAVKIVWLVTLVELWWQILSFILQRLSLVIKELQGLDVECDCLVIILFSKLSWTHSLRHFLFEIHHCRMLSQESWFLFGVILNQLNIWLELGHLKANFLPCFDQDNELIVDKDNIWRDLDALNLKVAGNIWVTYTLNTALDWFHLLFYAETVDVSLLEILSWEHIILGTEHVFLDLVESKLVAAVQEHSLGLLVPHLVELIV